MLRRIKKLIPKFVFRIYHYKLALLGAIIYRLPSRSLFVIGVTGTKGKSSTTEILNAILEEAGYKTALSNTIRFKVGDKSRPNLYKMSMPGRFFMQYFLRRAVNADCTHAVIEITSEGARQFRNKWIDLDALIFTNLSPEHIESHGSYEKYRDMKISIARALESSHKPKKYLFLNADDAEAGRFLALDVENKIKYSLADAKPYEIFQDETSHQNPKGGFTFTFRGEKMKSPLTGLFNLYNVLAAATCASTIGIDTDTIRRAVEKFGEIKGRVERIDAGQDFTVVVDYAHTADSLEKLYQAFPSQRKICILGNTGGGRDTWKRPEMAKIADTYCDHIILTNEDPYDEDPKKIVDEMRAAITKKHCEIIMDRREAIGRAVSLAKAGDAVLISGKGTDPYIMGPKGTKTPWSDARVVREELEKVLKNKTSQQV